MFSHISSIITYLLYGILPLPPPQPFYSPFSGTTRVSRCQKRTSGLGRLTEVNTPTIRLGATPSGLTSAHLHHPPIFTGRMPSAKTQLGGHVLRAWSFMFRRVICGTWGVLAPSSRTPPLSWSLIYGVEYTSWWCDCVPVG